jgi:hypothetical protein
MAPPCVFAPLREMGLLIQAAVLAKAQRRQGAKAAKEKRPLLWRHLILKAHETLLHGYFGGVYFDAGFAKSAIIALAARCKSSGVRIICSPRRPALTLTRS